MAPSAIDAKAAERCAAIADAKQKGNEAASLPAPVTDVALSPSPHSATPVVCAFPCAGPCRRSGLVSQMSSRPCARAVPRTSDRARARTRHSERSTVMRVRTGICCTSAARTQPVAPFGRIGERDVQAGRAAARVDLLADDAEDRRDYVHVAHAEALDRRTARRAIRGRRPEQPAQPMRPVSTRAAAAFGLHTVGQSSCALRRCHATTRRRSVSRWPAVLAS
jgi:hypothetical protein